MKRGRPSKEGEMKAAKVETGRKTGKTKNNGWKENRNDTWKERKTFNDRRKERGEISGNDMRMDGKKEGRHTW